MNLLYLDSSTMPWWPRHVQNPMMMSNVEHERSILVTVPLVKKIDNQDEELQSIMTILKSLKKEEQQRGHFLSNSISSLLKT